MWVFRSELAGVKAEDGSPHKETEDPQALSKAEERQEQAPKSVWRSVLTFRWTGRGAVVGAACWGEVEAGDGRGWCCLRGAQKTRDRHAHPEGHLRRSCQPVQAERRALERSLRSGRWLSRCPCPAVDLSPAQTPAESAQTAGAP